jgi:hypothetical protein
MRRPALFRQADIIRAIKGAKRAGLMVGRVEIDAKTGNIVVSVAAAPEVPDPEREFDRWKQRHAS